MASKERGDSLKVGEGKERILITKYDAFADSSLVRTFVPTT